MGFWDARRREKKKKEKKKRKEKWFAPSLEISVYVFAFLIPMSFTSTWTLEYKDLEELCSNSSNAVTFHLSSQSTFQTNASAITMGELL